MKAMILGLVAAVSLAGCATTGQLTQVSVSPRDAQLAISTFDTAQIAAASYLRLPVCGVAPCRTVATSKQIAVAVRKGRKLRAYVEGQLMLSKGGSINVANLNDLKGDIDLIRSIVGN